MNSSSTSRSPPISESARQVVDLSMKVLRAMKHEIVDDDEFAAPPQHDSVEDAPVSSITSHPPTAATIPVKSEIEDLPNQETTDPQEGGNHSKIQTNMKDSESAPTLSQGRKRRADGDDDEIYLRLIKTEVNPVEAELDMSGIPPKYRQQFEEWQSNITDSSNIMKEIMASGLDLTSLMEGLTEEQIEQARKYMSMIKEGLTAFIDLYEKWQKKTSTSSPSTDPSVPHQSLILSFFK